MFLRCAVLVVTAIVLAPETRAQTLGPRRQPVPFVVESHQTGILRVKFREGLRIRLRGGVPRDLTTGRPALEPRAFPGRWRRSHRLPEARLEELRVNGLRNDPRVPDHNLEFDYLFEEDLDPNALIPLFHASELVEFARPAPRPVAPPTGALSTAGAPLPPDFILLQQYRYAAPDGIGADVAKDLPGGTGATVAFADIEYSWNFDHQDHPPVSLLGLAPDDPFDDQDHGTAVLGEIVGIDNGWGVTGLAPDAQAFVVAANTVPGGYSMASAITTALGTLSAGDVILIEQQISHFITGQLLPVEWDYSVWLAIITAVANGVVVVEAAGNGGADLDDPLFTTGHDPFDVANDSGAIMVGGGGPPGLNDRSRLDFSNFGSTLDLQGYGDGVATTGYGDLYSSEGADLLYAGSFGGTSSASPIVTGACLLLQSMHAAENGGFLLPADVRAYLIETGSPQLDGDNPATEHIGPRPDVVAARILALATWVDFGWSGAERGTLIAPYDTLDEGVSAVPTGGTIFFKPSTSDWTGTISKALVMDSYGGSALIGQ